MQSDPQAVLVVEDEPILRMLAAATISEMGYPTFEASSGDEALKIIEEHPEVCLIFTDISMPGSIDGVALAKQVHEKNPRIEILVTSGLELENDPTLPQYGTFVPKPYLPSQLSAIVKAKLIASSF